jgi:hypothetical protein
MSGRPPVQDPAVHVIRFRVTTAELVALERAARRGGYPATPAGAAGWLREVSLGIVGRRRQRRVTEPG